MAVFVWVSMPVRLTMDARARLEHLIRFPAPGTRQQSHIVDIHNRYIITSQMSSRQAAAAFNERADRREEANRPARSNDHRPRRWQARPIPPRSYNAPSSDHESARDRLFEQPSHPTLHLNRKQLEDQAR